MKISELTLYTTDVKKQFKFYTEDLGLDGKMTSSETCSIIIGSSVLIFAQSSQQQQYHFAINIPSGSVNQALNWLAGKCDLIKWHNNTVIRFEDWNADAIYFKDSSGNIVELIAREAIETELESGFNEQSLLAISEVGIGSESIESIHNALNAQGKIPIYSGDYDRFCALGDHEGLIIVANPSVKTWFPTSDPIMAAELIVKGDYNFRYSNGTIHKID